MNWLYYAAGSFFAWALFWRAELWLSRFHNAQQRKADALNNIAGALLKHTEWRAAVNRAERDERAHEKAERYQRELREKLAAQSKLDVHDDRNLHPDAQAMVTAIAGRAARARAHSVPAPPTLSDFAEALKEPPSMGDALADAFAPKEKP